MVTIEEKYGCLKVIDNGEEYLRTDIYLSTNKRYTELMSEFNSLQNSKNRNSMQLYHLKSSISSLESKLVPHYKCQCKCGRIYYYNEKTLQTKPKYCFYPIAMSTKHTYSISAQNATYRKQKKYEGIECVILCDKSECVPSEKYCDYYNRYKEKQILKNAEKLTAEISLIPRKFAENYEIDFTGKQYESLSVRDCCNDHLESQPKFSFTQQHKKRWHNIMVYKQYRCICDLCGKEHIVTCEKFGIFPPTEYGIHAYNGYWSNISCDCHPISSFQWIVNKLLFDNNVRYKVEYSFGDLFGTYNTTRLRFDFAVFNEDGSIECLIECQGEQHYMPVDEFGGEAQFKIQQTNDELKRKYCSDHKITLIEISYKDKKYEKVESILKTQGII